MMENGIQDRMTILSKVDSLAALINRTYNNITKDAGELFLAYLQELVVAERSDKLDLSIKPIQPDPEASALVLFQLPKSETDPFRILTLGGLQENPLARGYRTMQCIEFGPEGSSALDIPSFSFHLREAGCMFLIQVPGL